MSQDSDRLLEQILLLPPEERASLVDRVLASFDRDVEVAWIREARRRLEASDRDPSRLRPWDEAHRELEAKYRR